MGQLESWAIPTLAKAIRQVAGEMGYSSVSDALVALIVAQVIGAEGAAPGMDTQFGGTNNIGATQVTGSFWKKHAGQKGWGAFAFRDSDPNKGAYLGWYYIAPTPLDAVRTWLAGNWWGKALLSGNPGDATSYATILYRGFYFGGTHKGDHNHNGKDDQGNADATAQAAYAANIADYAGAISRMLPTALAQINAAGAIDPSTSTIDPSKWGTLDSRKITQDLYNQAVNGGMGSGWTKVLGAQWPSWDTLVAQNGAVWADGSSGPGSGGLGVTAAGWGTMLTVVGIVAVAAALGVAAAHFTKG